MAYTSGTIDVRSGTVAISISSGASDSFEVTSISPIRYINEVDSDLEDVTSLNFKREEMQFSVFDRMDSGDSFYDEIAGNVSDFECIVTFTDNGGTSYAFEFKLARSNVKYDELARTSQVTLRPNLPADFTIDDYFTAGAPVAPSIKDFEIAPSTFIDSSIAGDFVATTIAEFNSSFSLIFQSANLKRNEVDAAEELYITRNTNASSASALRELERLAALEGAIYGTGFGQNFFVDRTSTANSVTLSEDDFEEINLKNEKRLFRSISVDLPGTSGTGINLTDVSASTTYLNSFGIKTFVFTGIPETLQAGTYNATADEVDGQGTSSGTPEQGLVNTGEDAYGKALGAEAEINRISFTILGVTSVFPWQPFTTDGTLPSRFSSNTYRPSILEYDLVANKIKGEAYQIA